MINPDLERRYADCLELVDLWKAFSEMTLRSLKTDESLPPALEDQFLAAKARIAMLHDSFMGSLKHDKAVGSNMLDLVNRAITLKGLRRFSPAEARKMEIEWHEVFLLLNETISTMNEERSQLAEINETTHKMEQMREQVYVQVKWFLTSIYLKLIIGTAAAIFVVFGFPAFGIFDWDNLRDVRQLRPVTASYLSTMRSVGFDMAFQSMDQFNAGIERRGTDLVNRLLPNPRPDRTQTINRIVSAFDNSALIRTALERDSTEFLVYTYQRRDVPSRGENESTAFIFWIRDSSEARRVIAEARQIGGPGVHNRFRAIRVANVVVFITSTASDIDAAVEAVAVGEFQRLAPGGRLR